MSLLTIADSFDIGVLDDESATFLVHREVGTPKSSFEMDEPEECVVLGFSQEDQTCIAVLGPQDKPTDGTTPILCASNIKKARKVLSSRV